MSKDERASEEAQKTESGEATAEPLEPIVEDESDAPGSSAAAEGLEAAPRNGASAARPLRPMVLVTGFALILAVLAATMAGFLWWQYRQFYVSLDEADAATGAELQRVRADLRRLQDGLERLDTETGADRAELAEVERRLGAVPGRFAVLEQRVDSVQGGSFDARAQWLRAEAEYYLGLANTELGLARRWENAIAALELADGRLRELADPALNAVRAEIAGELLALRSVRLADIEGLIFSLARLAESVDEMPARGGAPENYAVDQTTLEDAEPGFGRLWEQLKAALSGIVRVERRQATPLTASLSAQEFALARRQLILELELARLAALKGEPDIFASSVSAAQALLERDFDATSAVVEGAVNLLDELQQFDIAPAPPDISGSLNLLRNAPAGGD